MDCGEVGQQGGLDFTQTCLVISKVTGLCARRSGQSALELDAKLPSCCSDFIWFVETWVRQRGRSAHAAHCSRSVKICYIKCEKTEMRFLYKKKKKKPLCGKSLHSCWFFFSLSKNTQFRALNISGLPRKKLLEITRFGAKMEICADLILTAR